MAPGRLNAFGVIFVHQHQLVVRFQKYSEKCSQMNHNVFTPTPRSKHTVTKMTSQENLTFEFGCRGQAVTYFEGHTSHMNMTCASRP